MAPLLAQAKDVFRTQVAQLDWIFLWYVKCQANPLPCLLLLHGESLPLGRKNTLYLIEEGLIASVPLYQGGTSRLCGLFGPKTVLGLVMALRDSGDNHHSMALSARALTNTRALCISWKSRFGRFLLSNSKVVDQTIPKK